MNELPTTPGSVIEAKPPGRKKAFLMALRMDGWWQRLDVPTEERGPFRDVRVLFDAGNPDLLANVGPGYPRTELRPMEKRLGCLYCGRPQSEHDFGTFCP